MHKIGCNYIWVVILLFFFFGRVLFAHDDAVSNTPIPTAITSQPAPLVSIPPQTAISTCQSRTVNYITHTLPQQCLKANWTRSISNGTIQTASSAVESASSFESNSATGSHSNGAGTSVESQDRLDTSETDRNPTPTANTEELAVQSTKESAPESPATVASADTDADADSPLDNAKFLSFEEWKKQNLARIGQSPENVGQGRSPDTEPRRPPVNINNALDSLGDDNEIDLDFGSFGGTKSEGSHTADANAETKSAESSSQDDGATAQPKKRKDAGVTCKERFNYASFDCAATVLKTNPQCKSSSSILVESKDSYMLNECAASNKFFIVELCEDILIDTVVLANFEFFSSTFRTFKISISDRYPVKSDRWKDMGTFEARNTREIQAFPIENPLIWARYLRIEFLTHYGNEYYCPVSLLRVHGTTMMEEFRHQEDQSRGDEEVEEEIVQSVAPAPEPQPIPIQEITPEIAVVLKESLTIVDKPSMQTDMSVIASNETRQDAVPLPDSSDSASDASLNVSIGVDAQQELLPSTTPESSVSSKTETGDPVPSSPPSYQQSVATVANVNLTAINEAVSSAFTEGANHIAETVSKVSEPNSSAETNGSTTVTTSKGTQSGHEGPKSPPSQPQPPAPSPSTQESFFKSVHKRLQMLESNSTLSLQYIEEQSRILRDAFAKVEKRQTTKAEKFLDQLNNTVITELKSYRQQYDQLWQSTVLELESNREHYQREMAAISSRLTLIADELVWQKRVSVVQSTLLLFCLGLLVFVRSGNSTLELPLMQHMLNKSHSLLRLPLDSPPGSPGSRETSPPSKSRFRRLFRSSGGQSDDDVGSRPPSKARGNPTLRLSPATPSENGDEQLLEADSPDGGLETARVIRHTQSGPATPRGTRENQNPLEWDREEPVISEASTPATSRNGDLAGGTRRGSPARYVQRRFTLDEGAMEGEQDAVREEHAASSVRSECSGSDCDIEGDTDLLIADGFGGD
jgi:Sad1 / UNC-like C-terminal